MTSNLPYVVDAILKGGDYASAKAFRSQPIANKISALEKAVVKPRKDDTPDRVAALVKELVKRGALSQEEAGPVYSDLLIRVHKFNGANVQENLATLTEDIRAAQSAAIRTVDISSLSNQTLLNSFFISIGVSVPYGQENFEAFKQLLRLFVNEAPGVKVFRSGSSTLIQVNIRGVVSVNLDEAFANLLNYWGVILDGERIPGSLTSKLSSNTRVLMMLLAPFVTPETFTPDSFLSVIMEMYKDTISADYEIEGNTESEVRQLAKAVGSEGLDLKHTIGYLLKSRSGADIVQAPKQLTPRQLQVLRYVQSSLTDRIDGNGEDPSEALDNIHFSFSPSFYETNGSFIRRLIHFMRVALVNSPSYFREIYTNKYWTPPGSFWSRNYQDFEADMYNEMGRWQVRDTEEAPVTLEWDAGVDALRHDIASPTSDEYHTVDGSSILPAYRPQTERPSEPMFSPISNAFRNAMRDRRRARRFQTVSHNRGLDDLREEDEAEVVNPYAYLSPKI